ncbi:MAG: hypothetical protein ACI4IX_02160 [Acutalibacteraceae bacterium]
MLLYINEKIISDSSASAAGVGGNGWMSRIGGETPLTAISIPGTHDSATEYVSFAIFMRDG